MLPLCETFGPTIQGEGKRMGNVSYFIRFAGCNFRCSGFGCEYETPEGETRHGCDSWYSVDPAFKKDWNYIDTYMDIVNRLENDMQDHKTRENYTKPDIVITGGEPLIHWKNDEFQKLLLYFVTRDYNVTIETNASLDIVFDKPYQRKILFSMSVKLAVSGEPEHKRINIDSITNIIENSPESYFKFVVGAEENLEEITGILEEVTAYTDVYLMPLGETRTEIDLTRKMVAEQALKYGFKYSPRIHIDIWNDDRAV